MEDKIETYSSWDIIRCDNADFLTTEKHECKYRWNTHPRLRFQIGEALNPYNKKVYCGIAIYFPDKTICFVPLEDIDNISKHLLAGDFIKIIKNKLARQELVDIIEQWEREQQLEGIPISPI